MANPSGFSTDHPLLRLRRLEGTVALGQLARGRFDLRGALVGMELFVDQRADGTTNLQALAARGRRGGSSGGSGGGTGSSGPFSPGLDDVRLDLRLTEALVEVRRGDQLLEKLSDLSCTAQKEFGSQQVTLDLDTRLPPLAANGPAGRLDVKIAADMATSSADARLNVTGLDLGRWQPLLATLAPGSVDVLAGVANGTLTVHTDGTTFTSGGDLVVEQPRLAGPALGALQIAAPRWHLHPSLQLATNASGVRILDSKDFELSLGFAELRAIDATTMLVGKQGLGLVATFAVEDLLALVPEPPAWLAAGGRLAVRVAVPQTADGGFGAVRLEDLVASVRTATGSTFRLAVGGITFADASLHGSLENGRAELGLVGTPPAPDAPATARIAGFGLELDLRADQRAATKLHLDLPDHPLQGSSTELLRYVVPLLAGLPTAGGDFRGRGDLTASLQGPLLRTSTQNWLQLLDEWTGNGTVALRDASFTPAASLGPLLTPLGALPGEANALGEAGRLAIDAFSAPWTLRRGNLELLAACWLAKGKAIGLSGTARLDGRIDYGFDFTALLRGHRDGERVLQALGGSLPLAQLGGTFAAPSLAMPDLTTVARKALEQQVQTQGKDLLRKALEDLLKKKR